MRQRAPILNVVFRQFQKNASITLLSKQIRYTHGTAQPFNHTEIADMKLYSRTTVSNIH